ncbi:transporter substrate-binding domain-containing protein [Microvirga sp. W0021]|uniref:Transporter substrate-binding domain-containing protein n=1 Tax=Hohaiivirga grylli TaxID=3133970 RepID=A0ABV0BJ41_9HYPH
MKKLATVFFAAMAAIASFTALPAMAEGKKWTKIVIGTEGAFPPYNLTRPDGTLDGYEIDLAKDICARLKLECTFVSQSFDGQIPALQAGKFDVFMVGMSITKKREEVINFSHSYGGVGQAFAVAKGSDLEKMPYANELIVLSGDEATYKKAIEDLKPFLKGKTIGVQTASIASRFLSEYFKDIITLREYKTTEQHDLDLAAGRLDAVMASRGYLAAVMKKPSNSEMVLAGPRFHGGDIIGPGTGAGFRKEDTELRDMFNTAIDAAIADGTIKRLSEKWFGFDITPKASK